MLNFRDTGDREEEFLKYFVGRSQNMIFFPLWKNKGQSQNEESGGFVFKIQV